jgi:hypothetical protein
VRRVAVSRVVGSAYRGCSGKIESKLELDRLDCRIADKTRLSCCCLLLGFFNGGGVGLLVGVVVVVAVKRGRWLKG